MTNVSLLGRSQSFSELLREEKDDGNSSSRWDELSQGSADTPCGSLSNIFDETENSTSNGTKRNKRYASGQYNTTASRNEGAKSKVNQVVHSAHSAQVVQAVGNQKSNVGQGLNQQQILHYQQSQTQHLHQQSSMVHAPLLHLQMTPSLPFTFNPHQLASPMIPKQTSTQQGPMLTPGVTQMEALPGASKSMPPRGAMADMSVAKQTANISNEAANAEATNCDGARMSVMMGSKGSISKCEVGENQLAPTETMGGDGHEKIKCT